MPHDFKAIAAVIAGTDAFVRPAGVYAASEIPAAARGRNPTPPQGRAPDRAVGLKVPSPGSAFSKGQQTGTRTLIPMQAADRHPPADLR